MSSYQKKLAFIFVLVCIVSVLGCRSRVVVGRSITPKEAFYEEPAKPEPKTSPAVTEEPEKKAEETKNKAEEPAPAPEITPAPAPEITPAPAPEITPAPAPEITPAPAPETLSAEKPEQATAPKDEREPTVTPRSSRREAMPDAGPAPYELDLSFGGFGLSQGLFDTPVAVAVDKDENIYVVDQGNYRIQKFDRFGIFQFAWGRQGLGDGEFEVVDTGGIRELRMTGVFEFAKPVGILLDTDELRNLIRITVADSLNHRLQRFLLIRFNGDIFPDDVFVKLPESGAHVADPDLKSRYEGEGIQVILDPIYINEIKADSTFLSPYIWGGLGFTQGLMNYPEWLAKDESNILYVSDTGNGRVQGFYVTPENPSVDTTFFREFGNNIEKDFGAGRLNEPTALVFDNSGYGSFLVLDKKSDGGFVVQRFDREGEFLGVFAESGGKAGQLRQPVGMAISPFDNTVFVTDRGHRKVMVYNNNGEFMFAFGGEELSDPRGITVLRNNFVYVVDAAKNMVYRYIPK